MKVIITVWGDSKKEIDNMFKDASPGDEWMKSEMERTNHEGLLGYSFKLIKTK